MRKIMLATLGVMIFLGLNMQPAFAQVAVTIDGRSLSDNDINRQLWEGHHLSTFASPLYKRIEADLHKHLPIKEIRTQDSELKLDQISRAEGDYDYSIITRFLANIDTLKVVDVNNPSMNVFVTLSYMPRWLAEPCLAPGLHLPIWQRPRDGDIGYGKWATVVRDVVAEIKRQAGPRVLYYEIWNEPESFFHECEPNEMVRVQEYAKLYRYAVDAIRIADPNGKVGGPAIGLEKEVPSPPPQSIPFPLFDKFLQQIALPPRAPLDFASWHRYYFSVQVPPPFVPGPPEQILTDATEIRRLLDVHGYNSAVVELIKSEWTRPATDINNQLPNETEARFGAHLPAHYYYMLQANLKRSYLFACDSQPENYITRWPDTPLVLEEQEKVRPNYNVLRIMKTLTGKRAITTTTGLETNGEGVNVLATADSDSTPKTFNIVIWNYREDLRALPITINVNATFPGFLLRQNLRFRRYLVSPQHSNWKYSLINDHLQMIEEQTILAGPLSYNPTYRDVLRNSVILLTFCPELPQPCRQLDSPPFPIGPKIRNLFVEKTTTTTITPPSSTAVVKWETPTTAPNPTFTNYVQYRLITMPPLPAWSEKTLFQFQDTNPNHMVTITGLEAEKQYQVRSSTTLSGAETISEEWLTFTTGGLNQTIYAFAPTHDTYLNNIGAPNCEGGMNCTAPFLGVHVQNQKIFLQYTVPAIGVGETFNSAKLRLFGTISGSNAGDLHSAAVGWAECLITCESYPAIGPKIYPLNAFVNPGENNDFLGVLTTHPNGGQVSFALQQPQPPIAETFPLTGYASRDNGTPTARGFYPPPTLFITVTTR